MFGLNWLDITIIVVLLIGILDGVSKGFIISFFNIAGIFIALYLSRFLMVPFTDFLIHNTSVFESLRHMFNERITKLDPLTLGVIKLLNIKGDALSDAITKVFVNVACFIVIFIVSTIIINILKDFLKQKVKKTPLIQLDRFLGGMIGLITASIFIFITFAFIIPLTTVLPKSNMMVMAIDSSQLGKYFYYFNFILPWLQKAHGQTILSLLLIK